MLKPNQEGFVTEMVVMLVILISIIIFVYSRVSRAN